MSSESGGPLAELEGALASFLAADREWHAMEEPASPAEPSAAALDDLAQAAKDFRETAYAWAHDDLLAAHDDLLTAIGDAKSAFELGELDDRPCIFEEGHYIVVVTGADDTAEATDETCLIAFAIACCFISPAEALELPLKIKEVGPEEVLAGVSLRDADAVRDMLKRMRWKAKIRERRPRSRVARRVPDKGPQPSPF